MRILLQAYNTFHQNKGGGVQTRIKSLYNEYLKLGYDVSLFNKWSTKIEDFDIIHFFKLEYEHYNLIRYAKQIGKKIVLSSIIPLEHSFRIKFNLQLCKYIPIHTVIDLNKKILDMCDIVITQSKAESYFISKTYHIPVEKLTEQPNGFNQSIVNGDPNIIKEELPFKKDFILQVGRIDSNKNQLNLIRALKGTDIPLVIIGGSDPYSNDYYEQCKMEAGHNVYFAGWISLTDPRLASAYAAAKVLVLPSKKETFGNVLIEGAMSGCTLACSESLPILEFGIKKYIFTFNPNSIQDIRKSLISAYNATTNPDQISFFKNRFSWQQIAQAHYNIYNTLFINKVSK